MIPSRPGVERRHTMVGASVARHTPPPPSVPRGQVERLARTFMRHPAIVAIGDEDSGKNKRIEQRVVCVVARQPPPPPPPGGGFVFRARPCCSPPHPTSTGGDETGVSQNSLSRARAGVPERLRLSRARARGCVGVRDVMRWNRARWHRYINPGQTRDKLLEELRKRKPTAKVRSRVQEDGMERISALDRSPGLGRRMQRIASRDRARESRSPDLQSM